MKEVIFGMGVGMVIGALLYKNNQTAKDIINKGQKVVENEIKNMKNSK